MDARLSSLGNTPLVIAQGDIDHGTCRAVEDILNDAIDGGQSVVLLDLSEVAYIDSGGLSVLFSAGRRVRDSGWLGLIAPNPSVNRLLELVGVRADPAFRIFGDRTAAEAAVAEGTST